MKRISKVICRNIQDHQKLEIEFDSGFNVILGENNSGKSSVIRAIYWVLTNSPSGDWMRRVNAKKEAKTANVKIIFEDGTRVQRIKGDNENKYIFNDEEFTGFGTKVPQVISEYFGKIKLDINGVEIRPGIMMDFDPTFLQSESAPVRGGVMNYLTGVQLIDKGRKEFAKTSGSNTREINALEKSIKAQDEEVKVYESLPELNQLYKDVAVLCKRLQVVQDKYQAVNKLCLRLKTCKAKLAHSIIPKGSLDGLKKAYDDVQSIRISRTKLSNVNLKLIELQKIKIKPVDLVPLKNSIEEISKCAILFSRAVSTSEKLKQAVASFEALKIKIKSYDGKRCGECGNKIKVK
jgi:DNA repair exonuclease SbcCD ATPase subunit